MIVADLIEKLQEVPQGLPVEFWGVVGPTPSDWDYTEVEEVRVSGNVVLLDD